MSEQTPHSARSDHSRPKVFTASKEQVEISITGRAPKKNLLTPLEKDVVTQMISRGETVGEEVFAAYKNTLEEEKREEERLKAEAEEKRLKEEMELKKQEALDAQRKAEEKPSEPVAAEPVPKEETRTVQPEIEAAKEVPAEPAIEPPKEVVPEPVQKKEHHAKNEHKPKIVSISEIASAEQAKSAPAQTQGEPAQRIHAHRPRKPQDDPTKPRLVSVVDYSLKHDNTNPAEQKFQDMANDISPKPPNTSDAAQAQEQRPMTIEERRENAAELARKIYEEKRRQASIVYKVGKFFGFNKE